MSETPFETEEDLIDKVFWTDLNKGIQYRISVSEFYDKRYIGIRKWVQTYHPDEECDWIPTKEGFNMPYELSTTAALWHALASVLSEAEVLGAVAKHEQQDTSS